MIDKINPLVSSGMSVTNSNKAGAADLSQKFGDMLNDALNQLNEGQQKVETLNESFAKGELSDVHQLTIAAQTSALALETTVQIRNKVIEAYQDIMRMQI
ncbi:flagellar hook-basal body complex protein FliE [Paenibacillus sp. N1-5-1-14]|uniref:flagellar hook-basal body complex protein FliE n=1 Tax=Paenibacillus radicibacter TaxID=2972488 RepID=UPI0021595913|nr:flagellar hook-basal body complex protein FliE [Paenibacillus radicibacter]MCR8642196.1 flagellar hook-basal body complex protein FliE [Paenibacillus radicibacter]